MRGAIGDVLRPTDSIHFHLPASRDVPTQGAAKDVADMKEKGKRMAGITLKVGVQLQRTSGGVEGHQGRGGMDREAWGLAPTLIPSLGAPSPPLMSNSGSRRTSTSSNFTRLLVFQRGGGGRESGRGGEGSRGGAGRYSMPATAAKHAYSFAVP